MFTTHLFTSHLRPQVVLTMKDAKAKRRRLSYAVARATLWLLNDLPAAVEGALYPGLHARGIQPTPAELAAVSALSFGPGVYRDLSDGPHHDSAGTMTGGGLPVTDVLASSGGPQRALQRTANVVDQSTLAAAVPVHAEL